MDSTLINRDKIDLRIDLVKKRFGRENPLLTLLIETKIVYELGRLNFSHVRLRRDIHELAEQLFGKYNRIQVLNTVTPQVDHTIYQFSRNDYDRIYAKRWEGLNKNVSSHISDLRGNMNAYLKYIYVIGPNGEWRHFMTPQPMSVSIAGRRDANLFPFHPFLAREFGLKVCAAGEFSIYWQPDNNIPSHLYLNNISGHYKPENLDSVRLLSFVLDHCAELADTRILTVCNKSATLYSKIANDDAKTNRMLS